MTTAKHTPTPWRAVLDKTWGPSVYANATYRSASGENRPVIVAYHLDNMGIARLIAVAPALLEAARAVLARHPSESTSTRYNQVVQDLREAVFQATKEGEG
jgi:RecJ-like exonuclease